ncbi:hypothetical protein F444_18593 [Phytophthora nicotianae P1976]|uniref:Uncharacterized protein n=1 Tax=Phytophthora nicotianae P1976 TaxID=1317066 RepID=A0A080ZAW3_PHYNI|nr:hypothetical protein F444_18593 [Phytophthora nicotianae P1976]
MPQDAVGADATAAKRRNGATTAPDTLVGGGDNASDAGESEPGQTCSNDDEMGGNDGDDINEEAGREEEAGRVSETDGDGEDDGERTDCGAASEISRDLGGLAIVLRGLLPKDAASDSCEGDHVQGGAQLETQENEEGGRRVAVGARRLRPVPAYIHLHARVEKEEVPQ